MGRTGTAVFKFTQKRKLVRRYETIEEAVVHEQTSRYYLQQAIEEGILLNEHRFSYSRELQARKKKVNSLARRVDSRDNGAGMFDIDWWSKVCY